MGHFVLEHTVRVVHGRVVVVVVIGSCVFVLIEQISIVVEIPLLSPVINYTVDFVYLRDYDEKVLYHEKEERRIQAHAVSPAELAYEIDPVGQIGAIV
jgi:hypothetical protein